MLRKPFVLLGFFGLHTATAGAIAVHVNINAIGGTEQTVVVNQQLPQRFVARATFDDGSPVVGLDLQFGVNACMSSLGAAGSLPCPDPATYGHFVGSAVVTTDAAGNAISAPFVAGSAQGSYSLFASRANWSQLINGQTLTDIPLAPAVSNAFHVVQAPALVSDPAPALSIPALIALAVVLAMATRRQAAA